MIKKDKNYLQNLSDYIKKNVKKGYTKESLRWALVNQGHSRIEVEKALRLADAELAAAAPVLRARPEIKVDIVMPEVEPEKSFFRRLFGL